jgi:hypothetical protein
MNNKYVISSISEHDSYIEGTLTYQDPLRNLDNSVISPLYIKVSAYNANTARIYITNQAKDRWEVPIELEGSNPAEPANFDISYT